MKYRFDSLDLTLDSFEIRVLGRLEDHFYNYEKLFNNMYLFEKLRNCVLLRPEARFFKNAMKSGLGLV